jgi:hypothetical protein
MFFLMCWNPGDLHAFKRCMHSENLSWSSIVTTEEYSQ